MSTSESCPPGENKAINARENTSSGRILAYARVSTDHQCLAVQLAQLQAAGAVRIFREKISGARADRPQLKRLIAMVRPGDTVLVARLDRLARSGRDLLNILAAIEARGGRFRSLADPWADTTTPHGRLLVCILGGIAEFERELIRSRTAEGRQRARAAGRRMGRPSKLNPAERAEIRRLLAAGPVNRSALGRRFQVSRTTISRQNNFA